MHIVSCELKTTQNSNKPYKIYSCPSLSDFTTKFQKRFSYKIRYIRKRIVSPVKNHAPKQSII